MAAVRVLAAEPVAKSVPEVAEQALAAVAEAKSVA